MPLIDYDTEQRMRILIEDYQTALAKLFSDWFISYLIENKFLIRNSAGELEYNPQKENAMSYKLKVKVQIINQTTGAVEDTSVHKIAGLDSEDVTKMRAGLIKVTEAWNAHGIEGQGKSAAE